MIKRNTLSILFIFFAALCMAAPTSLTIKGRVIDKLTGEGLPYSNVYIENSTTGTMTTDDGSFTLEIPTTNKSLNLIAKNLGYRVIKRKIGDLKSVEDILFELEEDVLAVEEVVVSANRNEVSRKLAPTVVNVLSAKQFDMVNACDLSQSLPFKSGVRVENNCQNCGFPQVRINGLEGPYTQILIDSRPVVSSLSGVYGLEQIPTNMIERVEVLRGGGSALYGSNAIAGVVNIITKDPVQNSFMVNTDIQSTDKGTMQELVTANASLVAKNNKAGLALFQSYRNRSPYDRDGDGFSEVGKLSATNFGIRGFYRPTLTSRLSLQYHTTNEDRRGGNEFNRPPHEADIAEQTTHVINSGGITYDIFLKEYKHKLSFYTSLQNIDRNSYYGTGKDPNAYGQTTDLTWMAGAQFVNNFDKLLFAPSTLTYGLEYQSNRLHDEMPSYDRDLKQDVKIAGLFFQNEWNAEKLKVLLGGRLDKHNLIDNVIFSPRVNLLYSAFDFMRARASFSTGYRAPQAYDEDLHVAAVGGEVQMIQLSKGLKPEKSNSYSASLDFNFDIDPLTFTFLAEGFYTDLRDVFYLQAIGENEHGVQVLERRNGKGAKVYGINFDFGVAYSKWAQLQLGYTFQRSLYKQAEHWSEDPEVAPTKEMMRTPKHYGYFTLNSNPFKNFNGSLSGVYTGTMFVPHFAGYIAKDRMEKTPDFFDLNLKFTYDIPLSKSGLVLQVNAGVSNILNSFQKDLDKGEFRDSKYFYGPTAPRTYFAGLRVSM